MIKYTTTPVKVLCIFLLFSILFSCTKDSDLFNELVAVDIAETIQSSGEDSTQEDSSTSQPSDPVSEETNSYIESNAPFTVDAGNQIPLVPSNPNRIIYIATDGQPGNSGLSENSPKDIASAFSKDFIQAGDVFYIKAGEYGPYDSNPANNRHYDLSNLPCTKDDPCYWIGYKNTPGDINATDFATISWEDYKSYASTSVGNHDLDSSVMPTFSGNKAFAPKYIDNETLFYTDGGEEGFVFRNIQIQYFRRGFSFANIDYSVFENVIQANHGWFANIDGQGGSNSDLQGTGWFITGDGNYAPEYNVLKNCAAYNMAFRGFTIGGGTNNLITHCESDSDIDAGNPQDYYFHTIGKNNLFSHLRANRLISSNHSGHGICFNQLSENNIMEHSTIYGTNIHFDGAKGSYANNIELVGDDSYGLFKGGGISMMDGAESNLLENIISRNGESGISFADSGKNSYEEHAGKNNTFRNITVSNKSLAIINLNWWNERADLSENNVFDVCTFEQAPCLFVVSRSNSNFQLLNTEVLGVEKLENVAYKNPDNYSLNSNTVFENSNFWDSEVPVPEKFVVINVSNKPPGN